MSGTDDTKSVIVENGGPSQVVIADSEDKIIPAWDVISCLEIYDHLTETQMWKQTYELKKKSLELEKMKFERDMKSLELEKKKFDKECRDTLYEQINDLINRGFEASGCTAEEFEALKRRRIEMIFAAI